jgi:hypothetical protein
MSKELFFFFSLAFGDKALRNRSFGYVVYEWM